MALPNRNTPLAEIDPEWAWQPWEPTTAEAWDTRRAALLFRRAGFGASEALIQDALRRPPQSVVDQWFRPDEQDLRAGESFEAESAVIAEAVRASGDVKNLPHWWLHRMLESPRPLVEKMTLFWHGHFATGAEKVNDLQLMYQQNQWLREHALGDFGVMVHGICKDPAMLIYLDSATNRKAHANENFARELMELFCLGEGNYSEADVQQLAKCFTGWEIRRQKYRFNPYQHDAGIKVVLGQEVESGESAVDRVLASPHLAPFIARKLFRFFVADEPAPSDALIAPLARQFVADGLSIAGMLRTLLGSRLLLSDWSLGRKVRSPLDLAIGLLRTLEVKTNVIQLAERLRGLGQEVFFPPNVKGWDGGRAWINSSTLVGRANFVHDWVRDGSTRFGGGSIEEFAERRGLGETERFLEWFSAIFLAVPLSERQRQQLVNVPSGGAEQPTIRELLSRLAAMPPFHLS